MRILVVTKITVDMKPVGSVFGFSNSFTISNKGLSRIDVLVDESNSLTWIESSLSAQMSWGKHGINMV